MKGFSLVEILLVIGIMAIVTVAALPNLRRFNDDQVSTNVISGMLESARKAQANSQSKVQCPNGIEGTQYWFFRIDTISGYKVGAVCVASGPSAITNSDPLNASVRVAGIDILDFSGSVMCNTDTNVEVQFQNTNNQFEVVSTCAPNPLLIGGVKIRLHNAATATDYAVVMERGGSIFKQ